MAKIKDICTINPKAPILADDVEVSFVPMPKVGEQGEFDPSETKAYQDVKKGFTNFQDGDVLFAKITPCMENGKGAVVRSLKNGYGFGSTEFHVLRPDYSKVTSEWLYYLTSWSEFRKEAEINMTGSAGQKRVPKSFLENYEVNLPALQKQTEMAAMLDQICKLIALRKEQLAKLDQLVKSRFIELFGEPMDNPKGWDRVNISTVVGGKVSNGFFAKRDDYCDDGNVKVLGVAHVVNRMYSNIENLPKTNGTETDVVKYGVKYGDMLFCRSSLVAAGIGKASIVPKGTPNNVLFECHVIRLPLDLEKCVPEFMQVLSTTDDFRNQIISQSKTATMTTIGQDGILKTDIILPPLELQKQFAAFVEQTDKSKLAIQQSLDKLELLKKSLMQEYFG